MKDNSHFSRRQFLRTTAAGAAAIPLAGVFSSTGCAANPFAPPIAIFSKVYKQTGLSLEEAAALTAEAGLDGVDCPVRPNDEILPERVKDDLPRYQELLGRHGRKVLLLTTAILGPDSPHTADILDTTRKLGVRFYRLGFLRLGKDDTPEKLAAELKPKLRDLAAMNKELGLCALLQNHSPSGTTPYLGGDLGGMLALVKDIPPAQLGVAFDLGHALRVHGDEWKTHFEKLKPHIRVAYIKDVSRDRGWVRFGDGEFGQTDYFTRLKRMGYNAPLSMHIEYDWSDGDKNKNRETLAQALKHNLRVLREWCAAA